MADITSPTLEQLDLWGSMDDLDVFGTLEDLDNLQLFETSGAVSVSASATSFKFFSDMACFSSSSSSLISDILKEFIFSVLKLDETFTS